MIMRLTTDNIDFVKEIRKNGMPYSWYISMKSRNVSDGRNFVHYENGKTVVKEYKKEDLPKAVQKFLEGKIAEIFAKNDEETTVYIYK